MNITNVRPDGPRSDARETTLPGDSPIDGLSQDLVVDVFARGCASRAVFDVVTSRWSSLALLALGEGGYRFNALRRRVEGVSEKMLSQTLQALERDGMVTREVVTTIPPRVEYSLTPVGERVAEKLRSLADLLETAVAAGEVGNAGEAPSGPNENGA